MKLEFVSLAQQAGVENERFVVRGQVDRLTVLDTTQPVRLAGLCLCGVFSATAAEGASHTTTVIAAAPDGRPVTDFALPTEQVVRLTPQRDGQFAGAFWWPLDGFPIDQAGTYEWHVASDGVPLGDPARLTIEHSPRRVRVAFTTFVQDQQGNTGEEKYMAARVLMNVWAQGRSAQGVQVRVKQPVEGDFARDAFEIIVPPEYRDFLSAPEFREAVTQYTRSNALSWGGTLDGVSGVVMEGNLTVGPPAVYDFELPEHTAAGW